MPPKYYTSGSRTPQVVSAMKTPSTPSINREASSLSLEDLGSFTSRLFHKKAVSSDRNIFPEFTYDHVRTFGDPFSAENIYKHNSKVDSFILPIIWNQVKVSLEEDTIFATVNMILLHYLVSQSTSPQWLYKLLKFDITKPFEGDLYTILINLLITFVCDNRLLVKPIFSLSTEEIASLHLQSSPRTFDGEAPCMNSTTMPIMQISEQVFCFSQTDYIGYGFVILGTFHYSGGCELEKLSVPLGHHSVEFGSPISFFARRLPPGCERSITSVPFDIREGPRSKLVSETPGFRRWIHPETKEEHTQMIQGPSQAFNCVYNLPEKAELLNFIEFFTDLTGFPFLPCHIINALNNSSEMKNIIEDMTHTFYKQNQKCLYKLVSLSSFHSRVLIYSLVHRVGYVRSFDIVLSVLGSEDVDATSIINCSVAFSKLPRHQQLLPAHCLPRLVLSLSEEVQNELREFTNIHSDVNLKTALVRNFKIMEFLLK